MLDNPFLRRAPVALAVGAAALLAVGCSSSSGSAASGTGGSGSSDSITVGYYDIPATVEIAFAQAKGYFTKVGLNVTLKSLQATEFVPAVTSGQVDVSFGSLPAVITASSQNLPVRMLFQSVTVSADNCPLTLQVLPSSPITSISQLAGKTVAVASTGSAQDLSLNPILVQDGVQVSSVRYLSTGANGPSELTALQKGTVAAAIQSEPYSTSLVAAKEVRVVSNLCVAPAPAEYGSAGYFTSSSYLSGHKSTLKLFEQAMADSDAYINANPKVYDAWLAARYKLPLAAVEAQHRGTVGVTNSAGSYSYLVDSMEAEKLPVSGVDQSTLRVPLLVSG
jgi:NitT/TauT family transport system substrate-binding protein